MARADLPELYNWKRLAQISRFHELEAIRLALKLLQDDNARLRRENEELRRFLPLSFLGFGA